MIKIKLDELLKNDDRSLNWLCTKTGISYSTLHKLSTGETKSISFDVLNKICLFLRCTPNDIIWESEPGTVKLTRGDDIVYTSSEHEKNLLKQITTETQVEYKVK